MLFLSSSGRGDLSPASKYYSGYGNLGMVFYTNIKERVNCIMRKCGVENLEPEMRVAQIVYSSNGQILVGAGVVLNERLINRLQDMGVDSIYIADGVFESVDGVEDMVSEQTRLEAIKNIKSVCDSLRCKNQLNIRAVQDTADDLIDEIIQNPNVFLGCFNIKSFGDHLFNHSVNVCILSIIIGTKCGYNMLKLRELAIGALLHDIGMLKIDRNILDQPRELTSDEMSQVKTHTQIGFDILRQYNLPLLSAHAAYQHHERWNGTGYPRGLQGNDIHEFARIVAVADVFDAMMADRPHRPAYSLSDAAEYMKTMANYYFEPRCVDALMENIPTFPPGSVVKLNTGEIGQVLKVNQQAPLRPLIRIVFDRSQNLIRNYYHVDLYQNVSLEIVQVLSDLEINQIIKKVKRGVQCV